MQREKENHPQRRVLQTGAANHLNDAVLGV